VTETLLSGRYRLDELIGRGGMASVWRATDTVLDRQVAVKRLHSGLAADDESIERFEREALLVARLSHPNLVHVLDRGEDGSGPYLVLELVEGENLKARIRREGPLPPPEAVRICAQVAHALEYAHGQGVVHRDIKAQNVLLTAEGVAKLADFGIARMMEAEAEGGLTRTDMLLGSADYLSPEQANGHTLGARSDVYSLGIVLYECLTATLPFMGDGFVAVAMKHCSEPLPDPRTVRADIPPWLAEIVLRATRKDPDLRFPDAAAMAKALEDGPPLENGAGGTAVFPALKGAVIPEGAGARADDTVADDETVAGPRPRRRGRRRRGALVALLVVVLVAAAAGGTGLWLIRDDSDAGSNAAAAQKGVALEIAAVRDLDPAEGGGDGVENPELRDLAVDGDPETAWFTERYQDTPAFGGLKDGVGLAIRFASPAVLTEVEISSPTPGAAFEIQAGGLSGPRTVLAEGRFTGEAQRVPLEESSAQQNAILWITELVDTGEGRFHAGVAEVAFRGVPRVDAP
jgi:eukaryotic-like serine/threonine-protein kinase